MKTKVKSFFIVVNDKGLHARPSTELVKCACRFESSIELTYRGTIASGKSVLGVLSLGAERGSKIHIVAEGVDAQELVETLLALAKRGFDMSY